MTLKSNLATEKSSTQIDECLHALPYKPFKHEDYIKYYPLKEGDVVIDVGAEVGIYTRKYSKIVGDKGLVVAMEPDYRALGLLVLNTEDLKNVKILPYALWNADGRTMFHVLLATYGMSSCIVSFAKGTENSYPVKTKKLDTIVKDLNIEKVNFIKMDIEAAEIHALHGMKKTLETVDALAIAAYHVVDAMDTSDNPEKTYPIVKKFLDECGFKTRVEAGIGGEIVFANRSD